MVDRWEGEKKHRANFFVNVQGWEEGGSASASARPPLLLRLIDASVVLRGSASASARRGFLK
jgi:hypothetical protein